MATRGRNRDGVPVATRFCVFAVTAGLFVPSCFLPVIDAPYGAAPGLFILLFGWAGHTIIPWLANICLLAALVWWLNDDEGPAWVWSRLAVVLSLSSWFYAWPFNHEPLLVGYYLWQSSILLLAASAWWAMRRVRKRSRLIEDASHRGQPACESEMA
jgi:hypothetical protein